VALAACAAPPPAGINDPHEAANRKVHGFNRAVDRALFSEQDGVLHGLGNLPAPVLRSASNAGANLGLPGKVVNSVLQGRIEEAGQNAFRFVINSTIGVAGLFDPAGTDFGLPEVDTDFGETLHVWGVAEGAYVELPILGPSTGRDAVGRMVDAVIDPVGAALDGRDARVAVGVGVASKVSDRLAFGDTVDSILHESADSYAQSRLLYLQSRRFQLGTQAESDTDAYDPYADPYDQ
jgi:phospholipid-binding lipoprotein MlaA